MDTVDVCKLCGINAKTSIIYALRDKETFGAIVTDKNNAPNAAETKYEEEKETEYNQDLLDLNLDLECPNSPPSMKRQTCPAIDRLLKQLIFYQDWINRIQVQNNGKNDIEFTTKVDIKQLTNKAFYKIFINAMTHANTGKL
eukprot:543115_1